MLDGDQAGVPVRDSKASNGPALVFSVVGWEWVGRRSLSR
ncbi:DUF397 domain-containing protein [Streptomyces bobili]